MASGRSLCEDQRRDPLSVAGCGSRRRGAECGMVRDDQAGSDRHKSLAQTVQPHTATSGSEHAATSARNSFQKWPRNGGLDKVNPPLKAKMIFKPAWLEPDKKREEAREVAEISGRMSAHRHIPDAIPDRWECVFLTEAALRKIKVKVLSDQIGRIRWSSAFVKRHI